MQNDDCDGLLGILFIRQCGIIMMGIAKSDIHVYEEWQNDYLIPSRSNFQTDSNSTTFSSMHLLLCGHTILEHIDRTMHTHRPTSTLIYTTEAGKIRMAIINMHTYTLIER